MAPIQKQALVYLLHHLAIGVAAGLVFCAAMIFGDVGGFGTLLMRSEHTAIGLYLFLGSVCCTFGSIAIAVAVMGLAQRDPH